MTSEATTSPTTRVEALGAEIRALEEALQDAIDARHEHQREIATLEDEMSTETALDVYRKLEERHAETRRAFTVANNNVEKLKAQLAELEEEHKQARRERDMATYRDLMAQRKEIDEKKEEGVRILREAFNEEASLDHQLEKTARLFDQELSNKITNVTPRRRVRDYLYKKFGRALRGL